MRPVLTAALAALMLAGCATSPNQTVAELNRRDPEYRTRDCRQARREASLYDENRNGQMVVALAGNLVVPFAGTAAGAAMTGFKERRKRGLNHQLRAACISDPLHGR